MNCPHCGCELGVQSGGLSLPSGLIAEKPTLNQEGKETPKIKVRGKAREYTQAFEIAWKAYGRKDQKLEAFGVWLFRAKEIGGEPQLLTLVLRALKWQSPGWAAEAWKFAPYFERYLKRRKWEDEPPPLPVANAVQRFRTTTVLDHETRVTNEKLAAQRVDPAKLPSKSELEALRAEAGRK